MPSAISPITPESQTNEQSRKRKKKHKEKDKSQSGGKKTSKKRQRDEDDESDVDQMRQPSPAKKPKTSFATNGEHGQTATSNNSGIASPIVEHTISFYLPLSPIAQRYPIKGICAEHISPLMLTYYPPLDGVVLSYRNVRVSEYPPSNVASANVVPLSKAVDEYAVSFVWVTADVLLLRLKKGINLEGVVNLQNESHLGLLCWNLFGVSIDRNHLPKDWRWREPGSQLVGLSDEESDGLDEAEEHGYFVDGKGKRISKTVSFRVRDFEALPAIENDRGFLAIEGTLLSEEQEKEQEEKERESMAPKQKDESQTRPRSSPLVNATQDLGSMPYTGSPNGSSSTGRRAGHRLYY